MFKSSIDRTDTHVYYNISIVNNTAVSIPATFSETRTDAIVDRPSDYHLSIASFTIPTFLPIFQFQPNTYSVTLLYQDTPVQVFVSPIVSSSPSIPPLNYVYSYQDFIDAINIAFKTAYNELVALIVGSPPAPCPPFMVFNNNNQIFSLVGHIGYNVYANDTSVNNTIFIYMNSSLISFFPGLDVITVVQNTPNGLDTWLIIKQDSNYLSWGVYDNYFPPETYEVPIAPYTGTNGVTTYPFGPYLPPIQPINIPFMDDTYSSYQPYFVNSQQFPLTAAWYSPRTLQITTTLLPVAKEVIPGINNNQRAILTDYQMPLSQQVSNVIGYTQYYASIYRLIDMKSTEELKQADISVYWTTNVETINQVMIPPFNELNLKLVFIKKTPLYNTV